MIYYKIYICRKIRYKMKNRLFLFSFIGLFSLLFSCSKDSKESVSVDYTCNDSTHVSYAFPIQAIMDESCNSSSCHGSPHNASGINLESYSSVKSAAQSDKFFQSIMHKSGAKPMPEGQAQLHDSIIKKIVCWRAQGFPEN